MFEHFIHTLTTMHDHFIKGLAMPAIHMILESMPYIIRGFLFLRCLKFNFYLDGKSYMLFSYIYTKVDV